MSTLSTRVQLLLSDRIQWMAVLIVACFVSVLLLQSQSRASYATYALALLMVATIPQWRDVLQIGLVKWIIALLAWLSASVFWSEPFEWRGVLTVWGRALLVFCFVVAMAECQLRGQLQRWLGIALTVVGAVAVVAAIVNFYVTQPADNRLNGLGQLDTHVIAALVYGTILIFVMHTLRQTRSGMLRPTALVVAALIVLAVFLSDSRNAWVSVSIGIGVFLLAQRSDDPRQFAITVASMGLLFLVVFALLLSNDTTTELLLPRGDSFRFTIWTSTFDRIMADSLLFGRGILTEDDIFAGGIWFAHPHNIYLSLVHQGGIVALALYGVVVYKTLDALVRNYENQDAKLALGILALALSAHLLDGHELIDKVGDTWLLVWLPIGLAIGLGWKPRDAA